MLVVIGGFGTRYAGTPALNSGLRRVARQARAVGGVEAGTWLLGHAGLLEGRAATTHWEDMEDFAAAFPGADVRPDRYVIDGPVFTTGGASPTFDLMLHLSARASAWRWRSMSPASSSTTRRVLRPTRSRWSRSAGSTATTRALPRRSG